MAVQLFCMHSIGVDVVFKGSSLLVRHQTEGDTRREELRVFQEMVAGARLVSRCREVDMYLKIQIVCP